jgi:hypothetical protein
MTYSTAFKKRVLLTLIMINCLIGCYKDPTLPNSLIPLGCRISQINTIDSTSQHTYNYQYDNLGNRTIETLDKANQRVFKFDSKNLYILSQTVNNVTLSYQYDSLATGKRITRITGGSSNYTYLYEGDNLKSYISVKNDTTSNYSFLNGKFTGLSVSPGNINYVITGEKISKMSDNIGNIVNYTYDSKGQVTIADYIYPSGDHMLVTYTYDDKNFYGNSRLLARGFPGSAATGQIGPGLDDFGRSIQINNVKTQTLKYYKKNSDTPTILVITYQHQYNKENYSLGYGRSDGARVRYQYTNCSNE